MRLRSLWARARVRSAILSSPIGLLGTAVVGVVPAHLLTYAAVHREEAREAVLAHTGHSYWDAVVPVALLVGGWSILAIAWRCFRRAADGGAVPDRGFLRLAAGLVPLQLALFVAVELAERLVAHAPLATLLDHALIFTGASVQLVVALGITLFLRILERVAEVIGIAMRTAPIQPPAHVVFPARRSIRVQAVHLDGAWSVRGPPSHA